MGFHAKNMTQNYPVIYPTGTEFLLEELGQIHLPGENGIRPEAWEMLEKTQQVMESGELPLNVQQLAEERQQARGRRDWIIADVIRRKILALGWVVQDTTDGQKIVRQS